MNRNAHPRNDKFVTGAIAFAICFVVAAVCAASTSADFASYTSLLRIDSGLTISARPVSVAVDHASGEVCVTDAAGTAFHVLDDRDVLRFVTGGIASLSTPVDGVVDAAGGIVFLDTGAGHRPTIKRLDLRGEPLPYKVKSPVTNWHPDHLTLTADGRVVTIDTANRILACHDLATGTLLWSQPLLVEDPENAACGRPAVAPDGRIFVPASSQHMVQVYASDGAYVDAFGELGTTPGRFSFPEGVAFTEGGDVLVLDRMRHKIMIFGPDLSFRTEFGRMGDAPGSLYHPVSIACDRGRIYVAQGFEGRVQVFRIASRDAQH